jgi:nucleoside-diphosphate-sugar epimerase
VNLKGRRILVTGAAGFIGSHLSERLAAESEVVLLDDFSVGKRENLAGVEGHPGVAILEADITDRERMREVLRGVDVVFHLAISDLRTSIRHPWLSHDINAGGTLALCLAAERACALRVRLLLGGYGTAERSPWPRTTRWPTTVYGASKLAGELTRSCHDHGLPVTVVSFTPGCGETHEDAAEVIPRFLLESAGRETVVYGDGPDRITFVEESTWVWRRDALVATGESPGAACQS